MTNEPPNASGAYAPDKASSFKGKRGMRRLRNALGYSFKGLKAAYASEDAFRLEARIAIAAVAVAVWLPVSGLERAALIAAVLLVLIVELLNSAIEAAIDRIGLDHHPLSGRAKDIGSAAVFVSLANTAVVWTCILGSR